MRTLFLGLMLIVVTVFGLSVTAEHPPVGSSSLMTQLLKPGQTVRVDEKEFGFVIRIASSSEENREKPNGLLHREQRKTKSHCPEIS